MYTILIFIVIGLIIANAIAVSDYGENILENIGKHIGYTLLATMLSGQLSIILIIILLPKFGWVGEGEYDAIFTHEFETVYDNGEFIFGSEIIDGELMYCYYKNPYNGNTDDIVEKVYIHADLTTIHQVDSVIKPYIDVHVVSDKNRNPNWFPVSSNHKYQEYHIYIPKIR